MTYPTDREGQARIIDSLSKFMEQSPFQVKIIEEVCFSFLAFGVLAGFQMIQQFEIHKIVDVDFGLKDDNDPSKIKYALFLL